MIFNLAHRYLVAEGWNEVVIEQFAPSPRMVMQFVVSAKSLGLSPMRETEVGESLLLPGLLMGFRFAKDPLPPVLPNLAGPGIRQKGA